MATEWAAAHPVDDLDDAATVEGTEGELAIAGPGAPLVAEFCVADFALAVGVTTDAGRSYLGDAVEVRH
ncbi:MAG TPA: HNH endonuclease, partial [Nocardioides sp.]